MENDSNGVQYFVARIEEFEKMYGMKSWNFQLLYERTTGRRFLVITDKLL